MLSQSETSHFHDYLTIQQSYQTFFSPPFRPSIPQKGDHNKEVNNTRAFAETYTRGRFWRWDESARVWKESHLLAQKFDKAKAAEKRLTPEAFLTSDEFIPMDDYELPDQMLAALRDAKPCKNAPIDPVEEESVPAASAGGSSAPMPSAPGFDFGADDETNALLLQDAQTFITGNMARIMAAKHAHDLTANHYKGSWGKWCAAVGISRDTGDRMVSVAAQCGNIQLEGKSILDVQPLKLLYAAAKPSTPTQVKQAVFSGDITSYKEYQELLAQVKAEKDRADAAETERDKLLGAQNRAAWAESHIQDVEAQRDAALADVQGLTEQNAKLQQSYHDADEGRIAARLQCQKAEGERDRAEERAKNAEDALKKQPITAVIDEEEIDRRAAEKAWGLADARNAELAKDNANLKKQVAALRSRINDDAQADFEQANYCASLMRAAWDNSKASYSRLVGEDLESTFQTICGTLNSIMEEASLLCRQPPDYDGGDRDE